MKDIKELKTMQSYPLEVKILKTQARIREWVNHYGLENVYVSFSGGKDSAVLLDIARKVYPTIEGVFVDTGLEYPEIREFVKTFDNITWLHPKMSFYQVIKKYGYPMISKEISECVSQARLCLDNIAKTEENSATPKYLYRLPKLGIDIPVRTAKLFGMLDKNNNIRHDIPKEEKSAYSCEKYQPLCYMDFKISNRCCNVMKKSVVHSYKKYPITAQTADESRLRTQQWLKNGCNGFNMKKPVSNPMSFWMEQDVLQYIKQNNLPIASVYGDIIEEQSCEQLSMFDDGNKCGSCKLKPSGVLRTGCVFCGYGAHLEKEPTRFQRLKKTHPKIYDYCMNGGGYDENGTWQPNKQGLGMRHIFEELNKIYGDGFIKYE